MAEAASLSWDVYRVVSSLGSCSDATFPTLFVFVVPANGFRSTGQSLNRNLRIFFQTDDTGVMTEASETMGERAKRDRPWMMRTYSGHSTAAASNELYRTNLSKGQTGLSIAFDLPTQTGYDPDDQMSQGEVAK